MVYPKPIMSVTEMIKLGFPEDYIRRMCRHKEAHKYVTRKTKARNSKFFFDTEEFEKLRKKGILK